MSDGMEVMNVLIYRGPSGSGKSTHAVTVKNYCRENDLSITYCSADDYFLDESFEYKFKPHKISHAHEYCYNRFVSAIGARKDWIIVDNTNLALWEIMPYLQLANYYRAEIHIIQFDAPWQVRMANQMHDLPQKKLAQQKLNGLPEHILHHYIKTVTECFDYNMDEAKAYAVGHDETHLGKYVWLGQIGLTIDSTDCDHCQRISHRVLDLPAYRNYVANTYDSAEGPTHISHYHPKDHDKMEEYSKDHIAEAHENGHPHVVNSN